VANLIRETRGLPRGLARSVAEHRRAGGVPDNLPADGRRLLQAMTESRRQVFLEELAQAGAEAGQQRSREQPGK
jgi:hypothetical protein